MTSQESSEIRIAGDGEDKFCFAQIRRSDDLFVSGGPSGADAMLHVGSPHLARTYADRFEALAVSLRAWAAKKDPEVTA